MKKKSCVFLFVVIAICSLGLGILNLLNENGIPFNNFDPGIRYESSILNYMDVIYENQSDNLAVNEAFSNTESSPWGFAHDGFDFFLKNNSAVLAAAPGQIVEISYTDNGEGYDNRYWVTIKIRFNASLDIGYNFESWTTNAEDWESQKSMISVQEGDWVEIGQVIGYFLNAGGGGHIHFDVYEGNEKPCLTKYFSSEGYSEIMSLIHSYHPDWDLCYTE